MITRGSKRVPTPDDIWQILEDAFRLQKDTLRLQEENAREIKALQRAVAEDRKRHGDFYRGEGEIREIECAGALRAKGELGGIKLDEILENFGIRHLGQPRDIDFLGLNCEAMVVGEVKRTLSADNVRYFLEAQLPLFSDILGHAFGRRVVGAMVFTLAHSAAAGADGKMEDPVQMALDAGVILVRSSGKNKLEEIASPADVKRRIKPGKNNGKTGKKTPVKKGKR